MLTERTLQEAFDVLNENVAKTKQGGGNACIKLLFKPDTDQNDKYDLAGDKKLRTLMRGKYGTTYNVRSVGYNTGVVLQVPYRHVGKAVFHFCYLNSKVIRAPLGLGVWSELTICD